jgi:Dolichyl-phosphate-mannose-protein mannosyltransferase
VVGSKVWTTPGHRPDCVVVTMNERTPLTLRAADTDGWRAACRTGAVAYLLSRVFVVLGAGLASAARAAAIPLYKLDTQLGIEKPKSALTGMIDALTAWDGRWYYEIVRFGYPSSVPPNITYEQTEARAAFFPVYPWIIRAADKVLPGSGVTAGLIVNAVLGAIVVYLVGRLTLAWFNETTVARRAMVLAAFFPGSYVLTITYSEATLLVAVLLGLLYLHRHQWLAAGIASLVATACRPNGVAMVAACAVAAFIAIRARREWRALIAPLLAPIGFVAVQLYIGGQANERSVWFRVQREAWQEGTSFGWTALKQIGDFASHPFSSPTNVVTVASIVSLVIGAIAMRKARPPAEAVAYTVAVVVLMLLPATVTARPRFVYTAIPLIIAAARVWPKRWSREADSFVYAMCGAGLVTLMTLYGLYAVVIP